MKPIDFRNANFESISGDLEGWRREVYEAWLAHGPATTRQLARKSGIDLLTLRPRTTELLKLGLVEVVEDTPRLSTHLAGGAATSQPGEGIYRARSRAAWETWVDEQREGKIATQAQLI